MPEPPDAPPASVEEQPLSLARLLPAGEPAGISQLAAGLAPDGALAPEGRPRVALNMVSTLDGRATVAGRSGPISGRADRELFHALRARVDAVLAGAGTVRAERYGRMIKDQEVRTARSARGLSEEPLACIVTGRLELAPDIPLLAEPAAHVVLLTSSAASLREGGARIDYVRAERDGLLDLPGALTQLRERFGVRSLLCEGGPHLARQLLAEGLLDELLLSLSPVLAGGEPTGGEALRILSGGELEPPVQLELLGVLSRDSYLFLRYGVSAV